MIDLLSRAELVSYFRTEEYADEIADIISNFPPADHLPGVAQQPTVALRETIKEGVRLINVAFGELAAGASRYCPRHERDKFEANFYAPAREWLNAANAALAAPPPAVPVETKHFAELVDAGIRHAEGLTAQLAKPDWVPRRSHIEQARNSIAKLAGMLKSVCRLSAEISGQEG